MTREREIRELKARIRRLIVTCNEFSSERAFGAAQIVADNIDDLRARLAALEAEVQDEAAKN